MAARRRLAEKISKVKERAGLETPILDEVPLKARVIESLDFPLPRVEGIIPVIAKGKAHGDIAGRWYRVTFPRVIIDPSVVCAALARKGEIPQAPPPKEIPELKTILEEALPKIELPHVPESIGYFECGWAISGLCDGLNDMVNIVEQGLKRINQIIDRIDARLETIRTTFNTKLGEIDDRLETLRTNVNTSLRSLFPNLYAAWGVRRDMAPTILNTRNITSTGFEFLSMSNTTAHWIAVGSRR